MAIRIPQIIEQVEYILTKVVYDLESKTFVQQIRGPMGELKEFPLTSAEALEIIGETKHADDVAIEKIDGAVKVEVKVAEPQPDIQITTDTEYKVTT